MATPAHCAFCFETLSASLDRRPLPNLRQVELLWEKYTALSTEDEDEGHANDEDDDGEDVKTHAEEQQVGRQRVASSSQFRPAAISRLLAPSPSTASSSSASTPSSGSSSSLRTDASSATSASSSRSSLFSFIRRSRDRDGAPKSGVDESPLFVTWNTLSRSGNKSLRGCIGTFEAQKLDEGLRSYALTSALEDTRFHPIALRELPTLEVGVTLLTDFEPAADPMAWELGKHGLRISFTYHSRRYGATYLPDVPREQGWTKEETITSLMRKAGWSGRRDDWRKVGDLSVIRYQGRKVAMDYRQWKDWRDWVEESGLGSGVLS